MLAAAFSALVLFSFIKVDPAIVLNVLLGTWRKKLPRYGKEFFVIFVFFSLYGVLIEIFSCQGLGYVHD